jgi:fructose-bisphosphate aldolase class II
MTLVSGHHILAHAQAGVYAVGAFNADNMEVVQAIVEAAWEERAPVILQVSVPTIHYAGLAMAAAMIKAAAAQVVTPVVLHLDHGDTFELNLRCLDEGFTSLMFDGSALPYEENVAETARIVDRAHAVGVPVEAELGRVLQDGATAAEIAAAMTDPDQAGDFVRRSGCDSLAVAVGSVHAMKERCAELDIDRVRAITARFGIPLVLHGGSGIREDSLLAAIEHGVCKVNIGTYLKQGFVLGMSTAMAEAPGEADFRRYLAPARAEVKERVRAKIRLLGSAGRVDRSGVWRDLPTHHPAVLSPQGETTAADRPRPSKTPADRARPSNAGGDR